MKPVLPHDPLDDLIAAALHGELTPEERTQFESRLISLVPKLYLGTHLSAQFHCPTRRPEVDGYQQKRP
jgi:hypothetical protein